MIAEYLDIAFDNVMLTATIFGNKVKGNSSEKRDKTDIGSFYKSDQVIPNNLVPEEFFHLWKSFDLIKYKNWLE